MSSLVAEHLDRVRRSLPEGVTLVAVSKFHPAEVLPEAYHAGQRLFGESRVQELEEKRKVLPADIQWHFIGHLQTNKVRYIVPYISLIHSVDSVKLLAEIERQAARVGRVVDCLLEVHVAAEETKYGFSPDESLAFLADFHPEEYRHVSIRGLMGMASNTDDEVRVAADFATLKGLFDAARSRFGLPRFDTLSMGMSHDYGIAVREGSNMVRVGTTIFGDRQY